MSFSMRISYEDDQVSVEAARTLMVPTFVLPHPPNVCWSGAGVDVAGGVPGVADVPHATSVRAAVTKMYLRISPYFLIVWGHAALISAGDL
jgi:hypothetical protein